MGLRENSGLGCTDISGSEYFYGIGFNSWGCRIQLAL